MESMSIRQQDHTFEWVVRDLEHVIKINSIKFSRIIIDNTSTNKKP